MSKSAHYIIALLGYIYFYLRDDMEDRLNNNEFYDQSFSNIDYSKEDIASKVFDSCHFESCDFSEAVFRKCEFTDCKFVKCNLNLLRVDNSKFTSTKFTDCKLMGVNWTKAYWRGLTLGSPFEFKRCLLNSSTFYALNQTKIVIEDCRAHDVDFRESNLSGASLSETDFSNSLFSNTNLTGANFVGARNYSINITRNKVKNAKFCRYEAVSLLELLDIKLVG